MPRCKVQYFRHALSARLWPGFRGDAVIVGASYNAVTQMVELVVEGPTLPDSEYAHAHTSQETRTTFSPGVA